MIKRTCVLLINPPGKKKYHRDYYCSDSPKSEYLFQPVDLLYQSGILKNYFELVVIDAIAENLSPEDIFRHLDSHPTEIRFCLGLISGASHTEDLLFYKNLTERYRKIQLCVSGDFVKLNSKERLQEFSFIDGILLNFFSNDLAKYWQGQDFETNVLITRKQANRKTSVTADKSVEKMKDSPPAYELFPLKKYKFPFSKTQDYMTVLTDFGCPYSCSYCPMGNMEHFFRDIKQIDRELSAIKNLGISEIFIKDQSFGFNQKRTDLLLPLFKKHKMSWTCFVRPEYFTEALAEKIHNSGGHTVMMGVESSNSELLKKFNRNSDNFKIQSAIQEAKKNKLRVVVTIIFGLPGDTLEGMRKTLEFILRSQIDFVSFNSAVARHGTRLRQIAIAEGWIGAREDEEANYKLNGSNWKNLDFSAEDVDKLMQEAYRRFYFRPAYIFKRMLSVRSVYEAKNLIKQAFGILKHKIF